jgi:hypothetical protein
MNDRPKLTEITDAGELAKLHDGPPGLDRPYVFSNRVNDRIHFWADAAELRAWRAGSQNTSASKQEPT